MNRIRIGFRDLIAISLGWRCTIFSRPNLENFDDFDQDGKEIIRKSPYSKK